MGDIISNNALSKIVTIDSDGNEIDLGEGIIEIKSIEDINEEDFIIGIDKGSEDYYIEETLSVDVKIKRMTKRKTIKIFMSKGIQRNKSLELYKLYINTMNSRTVLGLQLFMAMYAIGGRDD